MKLVFTWDREDSYGGTHSCHFPVKYTSKEAFLKDFNDALQAVLDYDSVEQLGPVPVSSFMFINLWDIQYCDYSVRTLEEWWEEFRL